MEKQKKEITIDELKFDEHNFNKHTSEGMSLLEKSVKNHKFGRSILVDKDNNIIAGNGIVETAKKLDMKKMKVIETTGDELVVVKRTDVDINTKEGREMALADNATSASDLAWDYEELRKAQEQYGFDAKEWDVQGLDEQIDAFTQAVDDEFNIEDAEIETNVKFGDVYQLGEHKLMCGDTLDNQCLNTLLGGVNLTY